MVAAKSSQPADVSLGWIVTQCFWVLFLDILFVRRLGEGKEGGREGGREEERKGGREKGRKEGRNRGRKEGRKQGRKERAEGGRKEERNE